MSENLKHYAHVLKKFKRANSLKRKKILQQNLNKDFIHCICECCKNILNGNIKLTSRQLKDIRRRKHILRELIVKRISLAKKRKLIQRGGFLGAILGPIVSVLSTLFNK